MEQWACSKARGIGKSGQRSVRRAPGLQGGRRLLQALAWGAAAAAAFHLLHALAVAPAAATWLYDVMDLPFALTHHLGPLWRWGGLAAGLAGAARLLAHGAHHLRRHIIIFRL